MFRCIHANSAVRSTVDKSRPLSGSRPGPASPGWRGKSFIGGGRKSVRSSLFVGAMVAARYNPQLKNFRDKLVAVGFRLIVALQGAKMSQKSGPVKESAEKVVKAIRRATRRHFSAEDKIRIVVGQA